MQVSLLILRTYRVPSLCSGQEKLLWQKRPRQIIAQTHGDHDQQPEKAGGDCQLGELAAVVDVHKEENDQDGFYDCNRQGDHRIPFP